MEFKDWIYVDRSIYNSCYLTTRSHVIYWYISGEIHTRANMLSPIIGESFITRLPLSNFRTKHGKTSYIIKNLWNTPTN